MTNNCDLEVSRMVPTVV